MTSATLPGIDLRWGGITPAAGDVFEQFNLYRRKTGESAWTRIATVASQATGSLTTSGNEITDATRQAGVQGDGRAYPDSSFGIWAAATNLWINGNADSNTTGVSPGAGAALSRITTDHLFGSTCFQVAFSGGANYFLSNTAAITCLANQPVTFSWWQKTVAGAPSPFAVIAIAGGAALASGAPTAIGAVGAWTRYALTATAAQIGSNTSLNCFIENTTVASATVNLAGIQVEQGAFATPYIDTNGATASRGAARVQAPSSVLSPVQGWTVFAVGADTSAAQLTAAGVFARLFDWSDGSSTNEIVAYWDPAGSKWGLQRTGGGVTAIVESATQTFLANTTQIIAIAWTATTLLLSVNGNTFVTVAQSAIPSGLQSLIDLGTYFAGGAQISNRFAWIAAGAGTLTNADAATLGALGATDPTWAQLLALNGGAASPTLLWTADTATYSTPLSYSDYNVASGQSYDYEVTATVLRSGTPIESLAGTASGSVTFAANFLHQVSNPANYLEVKSNDIQTVLTPDVTLRKLWGRKRPTGFVGEQLAATFKVVVAESMDTDYSAWNALLTLFEQQRDAGAVFCYRPRFNPERWFVALVDVNPREDFVGTYAMTLDLAEVDFDESV